MEVSVVGLLKDPDAPGLISEDRLLAVFGLTKAECRVALGVLEGWTAVEMSRRFGTTVNTVNSQLKGVFAKVGVRKRSALVKAILRVVIHGARAE